MLIDRSDQIINLCEIKFSTDEFAVDKEYDQSMRRKISTFVNATKTKKTIQTTMITTYGLKRNMYSSVINSQVVLDDLFS